MNVKVTGMMIPEPVGPGRTSTVHGCLVKETLQQQRGLDHCVETRVCAGTKSGLLVKGRNNGPRAAM